MNNKQIEEKNKQYLSFLKQRNDDGVFVYPNTKELLINENKIMYNSSIVDLNNIQLFSLDQRLFSFSTKDIIYTLKIISQMINDVQTINNKISYAEFIINSNVITNEQAQFLYNYVDEYYSIKKINENFELKELKELEISMSTPMHLAYFEDNNNKQGSIYLKEIELSIMNKNSNSEGSKSTSKSNIRTLKSAHSFMPFEENNILEQTAAFMNATLVISITASLGIVLSILLFFVANNWVW